MKVSLHLQGRKSADQETRVQQVARPRFIAQMIFNPEDGDYMFF
jgi:hypothetical protein